MDRRHKAWRRSVFAHIEASGHCDGFEPVASGRWMSTSTLIGSPERVEVYSQRVECGEPIWHPLDNTACVAANHEGASKPLAKTELAPISLAWLR